MLQHTSMSVDVFTEFSTGSSVRHYHDNHLKLTVRIRELAVNFITSERFKLSIRVLNIIAT